MSRSSSLNLKRGHLFLRPSVIAGVIALVVAVAAGVFAEYQNRIVHYQASHAKVSEQLGLVRAKLEGNINSNIQLVRGLVSVIATQPDMDQARFASIARGLVGKHSQLRNIAGAPGLVVSLMYPMEGNEQAIGLDYRTNKSQREAAMRAVHTEEMVLAGPVNLLQGGQGFVGRFPVFVRDDAGSKELWGLVSAVVDVEMLYEASGLLSTELPVRIAIRGQDATGGEGDIFFGDPEIFSNDPVTSQVSLPNGSWQIAAIPAAGWSSTPENAWQMRFLILLAGLLVILPISIAGYLNDLRHTHMQELARRQRQLQRLSERHQLALDTSRIGVWELNLGTSELTWDSRMRELYGVSSDVGQVTLDTWRKAVFAEDRLQAKTAFDQALKDGSTYHSNFRVMTHDGVTRWIRSVGAVHTNPDGQRYIVGVNWDVSSDIELNASLLAAKQSAEQRNRELEEARAQMERNSLHDSLTGLPNRRFLDKKLAGEPAGATVTALLHIDLDRFKQINDTLGHAAGDAMLTHAASVLSSSVRAGDFVARIGGDEFIIAIASKTSEVQLAALASRIIMKMREPVPYEGHECRFGVSIGIAMADPDKAHCGKRLLVDADIALYRAKSNGRNRHEFFNAALKAEIIRTKRVADDILNGLDRNEFVPYFQPQFDARTLDIVGVEALVRWIHPTEGVLAPDKFLKTAGELNVVPLIDRSILEQTLWQSTRWKAAGISIPKMSVNVSAGRLYDDDLIESLNGLAFDPGTLSFELLESIFLDDKNETIVSNIAHLKALGIDIEIDDFGTGFASIVSLVQVKPNRLKIDRQLIAPLVRSASQRNLIASIIDIGQSLGIKVVAEGVETREHAAILRDIGCDTLQGFALARPMASDELMAFVRREGWRQVA
ncbi:bifunctional diguanylate cyclase/phosphodiesterase [Hoeflea alexandrii]|uniref:bifunctional diguanylate cyclase/phosphodiesterase n=1 Tax=Hoeflea alexandrii TaxID=288436 RepID=UPI0022AEFCBC|nr:EAL domain-containing protein [Hoeflea alexandrii]MCZ4288414.1 EAL domain-containing protein [Hoeflea alexandrii]